MPTIVDLGQGEAEVIALGLETSISSGRNVIVDVSGA